MTDFGTSFFAVLGWLVGQLTWINAAAIMGLIYIIFLLSRLHSDPDSPYDIRDTLMDQQTGKASVDAHVLVFMAVLSAWVIVSMVLDGKPVDTILLSVLGIFVVGREAKRLTNAWKPPPPAEGAPDFARTTTETTTQTTQDKPTKERK